MGIVEGCLAAYTAYLVIRYFMLFVPGGEAEEFFAESGW